MDTSRIREGDIIEMNVRGQLAYAKVIRPVFRDATIGRRLEVQPLNGRSIPTRLPTPRQIVGHWSRRSVQKKGKVE